MAAAVSSFGVGRRACGRLLGNAAVRTSGHRHSVLHRYPSVSIGLPGLHCVRRGRPLRPPLALPVEVVAGPAKAAAGPAAVGPATVGPAAAGPAEAGPGRFRAMSRASVRGGPNWRGVSANRLGTTALDANRSAGGAAKPLARWHGMYAQARGSCSRSAVSRSSGISCGERLNSSSSRGGGRGGGSSSSTSMSSGKFCSGTSAEDSCTAKQQSTTSAYLEHQSFRHDQNNQNDENDRNHLNAGNESSGSSPLTSWPGLPGWRSSSVRRDLIWGANGAVSADVADDSHISTVNATSANSLAEFGKLVLETADVEEKMALTHTAHAQWLAGKLPVGCEEPPQKPPALPEKPQLVHPRAIPKPGKDAPLPMNAHMLHSLAHVELNAIHLAWDTIVRFSSFSSPSFPSSAAAPLTDPSESLVSSGTHLLPVEFFSDFARVADDEARHLGWCLQRLKELGFRYGDMPAHNLLWRDCEKSARRVEHRLAVIPLVQEARGLDAGPRLVERLIGLGDVRTAAVVRQIAEEELAHVAVGVEWFRYSCQQLGLEPTSSFKEITRNLCADGVKGPFNHSARSTAGLPRHWYDDEGSVQTPRPEVQQSTQSGEEQVATERTACASQSASVSSVEPSVNSRSRRKKQKQKQDQKRMEAAGGELGAVSLTSSPHQSNRGPLIHPVHVTGPSLAEQESRGALWQRSEGLETAHRAVTQQAAAQHGDAQRAAATALSLAVEQAPTLKGATEAARTTQTAPSTAATIAEASAMVEASLERTRLDSLQQLQERLAVLITDEANMA